MAISQVNQRDITIPSAPRRPGLFYGYYGVLDDDQIERTRNHTNLLWTIPWGPGEDQRTNSINDILAAKQPTFLDLGHTFFKENFEIKKETIKDVVIDDTCEQRVEAFFNRLQEAGALKYVVGLLLMDEFNLRGFTRAMVENCLNRIAKAVAKFPLLTSVKYVVTYGGDAEFIGMDLFDYVGYDAYHYNSALLRPGGHYENRVRKNLLSHQRTLIYPGGFASDSHPTPQDPMPFVNFAYRNYEVKGIIPFAWHAESYHDFQSGIKDNGALPMYEAAGKLVCGK